jgi:GNAT superfamily N-acetyltransferase
MQRRQPVIRPCRDDETDAMLAVINAAAQAYRGVIPADRWHEPYMPASELRSELASGVAFVACEVDGAVAGVTGIQSVRNVDLIRHAYVLPEHQGRGLGGALLAHLRARTARPILIGTWAAATWALAFYERAIARSRHHAATALALLELRAVREHSVGTGAGMGDPSNDDTSAEDLQRWVVRDDALRARAHRLAVELGRDEEGIYRTLKNLQRSPSARLRLGLRHARLHPDRR